VSVVKCDYGDCRDSGDTSLLLVAYNQQSNLWYYSCKMYLSNSLHAHNDVELPKVRKQFC